MDNKLYVYIHIPKTGGNSLMISGNQIKKTINHIVNPGIIDINRLGINRTEERENLLTVVRNPYTRFLSAYNYIKSGGLPTGLDIHYLNILNSMSLDDFIDNLEKYSLEIIHFVPQHYFTSTNLRGIRVIKFENFYKMKGNIKIKHHCNKTREIFISNLTEEQKDKIYRIYKVDFELFDYQK